MINNITTATPSVKSLIKDPELFLSSLHEEMQNVLKETIESKSVEWRERNSERVIGSSTFALCPRQAYYNYFTQKLKEQSTEALGDDARRYIYLGFFFEDEVGKALLRMPGTLHKEQNSFPIHLEHPVGDVILAATTDFVKEFNIDGQSYYIPIEVKSTDLYEWYKGFTYHEEHLRQLLLWIHYAKMRGLSVPYGILKYCKRGNFATKPTIISVDTPFRKLSRQKVDYGVYKAYLDARVDMLIDAIETKTLPALTDVPKYRCKQCPFVRACEANKNTMED
jgi:CRISPR/Cas system-associated exonuclease Cas4 (RecB family)